MNHEERARQYLGRTWTDGFDMNKAHPIYPTIESLTAEFAAVAAEAKAEGLTLLPAEGMLDSKGHPLKPAVPADVLERLRKQVARVGDSYGRTVWSDDVRAVLDALQVKP